MNRPKDNERGLSLIEMLVVVSLMGILAAIVSVSMGGFLSSGREKGYEADKEVLQLAVDQWENTIGRTTGPRYPILQSGDDTNCLGQIDATGDPSMANCNPYIDMFLLASGDLIRSADAVRSANISRNTTATNASGSYGWLVTTGGIITTSPNFIEDLYP